MLDILLARMDAETKKKKLQEEHNLPMTIKLEKEMKDICNLISCIREEVFHDGEYKENLEAIRNMIVNGFTIIEAPKATGYKEEKLSAIATSLR